MSVANAAIDGDHRYLLCLMNTVELSLRSGEPIETLVSVFEQLRTYTREHFDREERMMLLQAYPKFDLQKMEHQRLVVQLDATIMRVLPPGQDLPSSTSEIPDAARDEIIGMLKHWLIDHILKDDMQFKPLFSKLPASYNP